MKVKHVEFYAKRVENGVVLNEVSVTDKGVFVETITLTFPEEFSILDMLMGEIPDIDVDYKIEKVV